jgi:hypothetical protein
MAPSIAPAGLAYAAVAWFRKPMQFRELPGIIEHIWMVEALLPTSCARAGELPLARRISVPSRMHWLH